MSMSPLARYFVTNLIQIAFLLAFSPLVQGVLARIEEIIQGKHGPSIFQPYRDIWKLFGKDEILSRESTWVFRFAPAIHFAMPLFVVMLIPALTTYPLFLAFAGDMIAVGFLFSASGFFVVLAAMDTGNVYGAIGASRTRMIGFLAEPVYMVAFFAVFDPKITREEQRQGAFLIESLHSEVRVPVVDRLAIHPIVAIVRCVARQLARLHHGKMTLYAAYVLASLVAAMLATTVALP